MPETETSKQIIIPYITKGYIKSTGDSEKDVSPVTHSIRFQQSDSAGEFNYISLTGFNAFMGLIQETKKNLVGDMKPIKDDYVTRLDIGNSPECILGVSYVCNKDPLKVIESFYVDPSISRQYVYEFIAKVKLEPNTEKESENILNAKFVASERPPMYLLDSLTLSNVSGRVEREHNLLPKIVRGDVDDYSLNFAKNNIEFGILSQLPESLARNI